MLNQFPYTNFHELNLDWILSKLKDINGKVDDIYSLLNLFVPEYKGNYDPSNGYDPLNVVYYNGSYYMAGKYVPVGVTPDSTEYWIDISPDGWDLLNAFDYPDKYEGESDADKIQACFDAAKNKSGTIILFTRYYNLTKNVSLPSVSSNYQTVTIVGLGKGASINCNGYHFYSIDGESNSSLGGGLFMQNVFMYGTDYAFDADTLIRLTFLNCRFQDFVSVVKSTEARGYMQDMSFAYCNFQDVDCVLAGNVGMYSGSMIGCRFRNGVVCNIQTSNISKFSVKDCDIENYGHDASPFTIIGKARCLEISNNYIEPFDDAAKMVINCQSCSNGIVIVRGNYYNVGEGSGALISIAGAYPEVRYTISDNFITSAAPPLIDIFETGHHNLYNIVMDNNVGGYIKDTYGSIPLYRNASKYTSYPGTEIPNLFIWGTGTSIDLPLKLPNLTGHDYSVAVTYHYFVKDGGTFDSTARNISALKVNDHIRLTASQTDADAMAGKTVNIGITFNY